MNVHEPDPPYDVPQTQISVSTTFFPAALLPGANSRTDVIIYTSDEVFFYAHQSVIRSRSTNDFASLLVPADPAVSGHRQSYASPHYGPGPQPFESTPQPGHLRTIAVPENSIVFNVILHIIYSMSSERYAPDLETVAQVLSCLEKYGVPALTPNHEIWATLLRHAPSAPLRVYVLAACYAMDSVCILASQYTLEVSLGTVTEADALTMGAIYLRRLFFLHLGRVEALKRVIKAPPEGHPIAPNCSLDAQRAIVRGWRMATASVMLADLPQNTSTNTLITTFGPLKSGSMCMKCKDLVQLRMTAMVQAWAEVKRTI